MKVIASFVLLISIVSFAESEPRLFDNPFETKEIFGSAGKGDVVWQGRGQRVYNDYSNFVSGDFSIVYLADTLSEREVGFMMPSYGTPWNVGFDWHLTMMIKTNGAVAKNWLFKITDERGGRATAVKPAVTETDWTLFKISAADFTPAYKQFDFSKIIAFQMQVALEKGGRIWFDGIKFLKNDGSIVGISDKSISQMMDEELLTRNIRVKNALLRAENSTSKTTLNPFYAKLYLNKDVDIVNARLLEIFTAKDEKLIRQYGLNQLWHLSLDSILNRMYYDFGVKSKVMPGRLKPETEDALLALLWKRNAERSDISLAKQSTWWLVANESSDLISKTSALISSQIFLAEPRYKDAAYPDSGTGGGYGYWFHNTDNLDFQGPKGNGKYKDWKKYSVTEHYYAYLDYFKNYFTERAKKGFFVENGSPLYAKYALAPIYDIYSLCEDEQLKKIAGKFLDMYWAVWAQDHAAGTRGGARIRDLGNPEFAAGSDYIMAGFHLGCGGDAEQVTISQIFSGYRLPEVLWSIALDRQSMGEFAFVSRVPGEEENILPRPEGCERTILCDTESRLLRYSWVTPDYVLGCRMDYPTAVHSYISSSGTKYGMSFTALSDISVFPWAIDVVDDSQWSLSKESGNFRCGQYRNVMIVQQARALASVSPEWFPQTTRHSLNMGVYVNPAIAPVVEKDGWIFMQQAGAYLALRVIKGEFTSDCRGDTAWFDFKATESPFANIDKDSYTWDKQKNIIRLKDIYSPVIFEAGRKTQYPTLDAFIEHILAGQVRLLKTVVPGWYILQYTSEGVNSEKIDFEFNMANSQVPSINGVYVNYKPEKLFDSPYLQSAYNSGVVKIAKDDYVYELDFNR